MSKYFLCLIILASSASCGFQSDANPSGRFPFAYVRDDCGPTDGIVLVFYFTMKETTGEKFDEPFISVSINENLPKSAPQDYSIRQGSYAMLASRCLKPAQCVAATSGTLHLSKFGERKGAW